MLTSESELRLLLISFLHQTTTWRLPFRQTTVLLLISFLHQTTTSLPCLETASNCFLSHFYIKPQRVVRLCGWHCIASYLISTSNHNEWSGAAALRAIASYLISTSNHNDPPLFHVKSALLLISFLHQTTTHSLRAHSTADCFLSHFYIKPQHIEPDIFTPVYCFLSHFYIKPQPIVNAIKLLKIASYLISTSNHNVYYIITSFIMNYGT